MGGEWKGVRFGDLVTIKHGWPFKSEFFSGKLNGGPIVVNIGNFRYSGGFRFEETIVKEYCGDYPSEFELSPKDILLVMTCQTAGGEILGIPARVPDDGRTYLHNQRLGRVVIKKPELVDEDFLYWLCLWPQFNQELYRTASGTKILHTAPNRIEAFSFHLPPLSEQQAIAHILGTLDDKIELNRRMNETLEAMARAIFKSWFMDFDPVRAKAAGQQPPGLKPEIAALFPDGFENSELGEIPRGWRVESFTHSIDVIGGGTPKTSVPGYWGGDIPWFSVVDTPAPGEVFVISTEKSITQKGLDNSSTRILPFGTTVITARGTVGNLALVGVPMAMNQSCYGLRDRREGKSYFLYFVTNSVVETLRQRTHGSVFNTITRDTLHSVNVVAPPDVLILAFEQATGSLLLRILSALHESHTLASIRDTLLPKLLSGEIRVKDAERIVEKAV